MSRCRTLPAVVALALLAGCGTGTATPTAAVPAPTGPTVPPVVGLPLDRADAELQAAGFGQAGASDALRDRSPIVRSDWHVCTQQPGPGPAPAGTTLVGVTIVQAAETCPGTPATANPAAPASPLPVVPDPPPTPRPRAPRSRPTATTTTPDTPTSTATPAPDATGGPTVTAGTPCPDAGAHAVTRWGTPVVCRPGGDGRARWRRS